MQKQTEQTQHSCHKGRATVDAVDTGQAEISERDINLANLLHDTTRIMVPGIVQWQEQQPQVDVFACPKYVTRDREVEKVRSIRVKRKL